jgi:uncharacterized protein YkwD
VCLDSWFVVVTSVRAWLLALLLVFSVVSVVHADTPCWGFRCDLLNQIRAENNRPALVQRGDLQNIAESWAEHMAKTKVLMHNPDLYGLVLPGIYGENVGFGPEWRSIFQAFMESPEHRSNMLDRDFSSIGIGAQRDQPYPEGRVWIVLVFHS